MKKYILSSLFILTVLFTGFSKVHAGVLFPSHAPGETMYSLQEIYDLATASTTTSIGNGAPFNRPSSVSGSMVTLEQLYNAVLALRISSSNNDLDGSAGTRNESGILRVLDVIDSPSQSSLKVEEYSISGLNDVISFVIEAENSDIDIGTIQLKVETELSNVEDVISDFIIEIDGQQFDDWSYLEGSSSTVAIVQFDIKNDMTLEINNPVNAYVRVKFKQLSGNYDIGETVKIFVEQNSILGTDSNEVSSEGVVEGYIYDLQLTIDSVEDLEGSEGDEEDPIDLFLM